MSKNPNKPEVKKAVRINIRVTEGQRKKLHSAARKKKLTLSEFVLKCAEEQAKAA